MNAIQIAIRELEVTLATAPKRPDLDRKWRSELRYAIAALKKVVRA